MSEKKVLFLDIDGVLNNSASMSEGIHIIPEKCLMIRDICWRTGAKVVVSSTWRIGRSLEEIQMIFRLVGMGGLIVDTTPIFKTGPRGDEIAEWLRNNTKTKQYAIVDDDGDMLEKQMPYFVKTEGIVGLTTFERDKLIDILIDL